MTSGAGSGAKWTKSLGGLDRQDWIVSAISFAVFTAAGFLLYVDSRAQASGGTQRVVGTLTRERGRVQRRASDRALWQTAAATVPVFDREWVRTGEQADASIKLQEGGAIQLEAFSMITLYMRDRTPEVDLSEGSLLANSTRGLRVRTRDGRTLVLRGRARISRPQGRLLIRADGKDVRIEDGGRERALPPGTEVDADLQAPEAADGGAQKESAGAKQASGLPPTDAGTRGAASALPATAGSTTGRGPPGKPSLLFPTPGSVVDMTVRESLPFRWSVPASAEGYRFVLRRGGQVLLERDLNQNHTTIRDLALLDVGQFEWQVTAHRRSGGTKVHGPTAGGRFRIILKTGPGRPELDPPEGKKP